MTDNLTDTCSYQSVIALGFVTFTTINYLSKWVVPATACQTSQQKWKWRNVATSFIHSLITGVWAILCFYQVGAPQRGKGVTRELYRLQR